MCGRYAATANPGELILEFDVDLDATAEPTRSIPVNPQHPPAGTPDSDLAPTKAAPVVLTRRGRGEPSDSDPVRQLRLLTWGLVPSWSKDCRGGVRMINARAETLTTKPAFSRALASRRALVPARGWFEWRVLDEVGPRGRPRKQPYFMERADQATLAMAGLYEFWRDPAIDPADPLAWLTTFTIVTTAAEPALRAIHDRQPLVLERPDWARWLDPDTPGGGVEDLLLEGATPRDRFLARPVPAAGVLP